MNAAAAHPREHPMRRRARTIAEITAIAAIAAMSLAACGSHPATTAKASADPHRAAVTKTAACARVVAVKSRLSDIRVQVFQTMSVGNESGVWGPIVMDLDRQSVVLNTELTAKTLVCAGPTGVRTTAPSGGAATWSAGSSEHKVNKGRSSF